MSAIRQLFSVNFIIGVTLVIGLINNVAITAFFGLSRGVDAFFASVMLVKLFMVLVIDYLGKNFLPVYAARKDESEEGASRLASLVVTQIALAAALATGLLVIFAEQVFTLLLPGFEPDEIVTVAGMFAIMAPSIVLMTIEAFHGYVWQHDERFIRVTVSKIFIPLTFTVFILGFRPWLGIQTLPIGYLCGQLATTIAVSIGVPYRFRPAFDFSDPGVRKIIQNSALLMGTGLIARCRSVIVPYFGSMLGEGAIAAISIAQKICNPVFQSAQVGVRMIVFSRSARAAARSDLRRVAQLHNVALTGVLFFVLPVASWYALESDVIVRAVFQRGAFTDSMAELVAAALVGYSLTVVFNGVNQIISNGFYALDRIRVPAISMPIGTLMFLALAAFMGPAYGVLGLTLASSIASTILALVLLAMFRHALSDFDIAAFASSALKYGTAALIAVYVARETRLWLDLGWVTGFIVSMAIVGIVYLAAMLLARDRTLAMILKELGVFRAGAGASGASSTD